VKRRGHNMLEMMIACFIFVTIATALTGVWISLAKDQGLASSRLVAQHLAEQVMEECIAAGYKNVDSLMGPRPNITMNETDRGNVQTFTYGVVVTVYPTGAGAVVADPGQTWKVVTVKVFWRDAHGDSHIEFKTLLARHA
jgi:hypothetical protein